MGLQLPSPNSPAEHARTLMGRKESIEAEIESQISILRLNNSTMQSPLVDSQGFPRDDIDIYAVRNARIRVIELRNDLKVVMDDLGRALEGVYKPREAPQESANASSSSESQPFARVDAVSPGSPASEAGLLKEDLIVKFGPLTYQQCSSGLAPIAKVVADNEEKVVVIKVLRGTKTVFVNLSPRKGWGGRGMLGCHVVPVT